MINGFTINPVKDKKVFEIFINSLCEIYDQKHFCDHQPHLKIIHKHYLGKQIGKPSISYISNESFKGLIRICSTRQWLFCYKNLGRYLSS